VSDSAVAKPATSVSDPTPSTPIDILLADRSAFTAEEDAEIQRGFAWRNGRNAAAKASRGW